MCKVRGAFFCFLQHDNITRTSRNLMNQIRIAPLAVCLFGLIIANRADAVAYQSTLLHPVGFVSSVARGVSGASQVGYGAVAADGSPEHALLWSGASASLVDLNPVGFSRSFAGGVSGASQVGSGAGPATGMRDHALLWSGTAASVVDLNPVG